MVKLSSFKILVTCHMNRLGSLLKLLVPGLCLGPAPWPLEGRAQERALQQLPPGALMRPDAAGPPPLDTGPGVLGRTRGPSEALWHRRRDPGLPGRLGHISTSHENTLLPLGTREKK